MENGYLLQSQGCLKRKKEKYLLKEKDPRATLFLLESMK